jgi:inhibitor of the pro-sigma K processing machinery
MALGGLGLFVFNLVASYFGAHLPINLATAAIAGYLGVPGVALLVIVQRIV